MDNLSKSSLNFLTSSELDRLPQIRMGETDFQNLLTTREARFFLVRGEEILLHKVDGADPFFLSFDDLGKPELDHDFCFLLGQREELIYFAIDMDRFPCEFDEPEDAQFTGLRKSKLNVRNWTGGLISYANALVTWHRNHRFCGKCGSHTIAAELGQARNCSNLECGTPHYPRTDPAIIVAVTRGDKCLMARKNGWPEGMYSVVAGYVDHGESLEDTVVREVFEETGIHVKSVEYHSSQPWPFPYTLMLGYFAEATNEDIKVDPHELEEAKWFSRDDIIEGLKKGTHKLPTAFSISRKLITEWFNRGDKGKLEDFT